MAKKYRVELSSGRIIEPLDAAQIGELYKQDYLLGSEKVQIIPNGHWAPLQDFKELKLTILKIINHENKSEKLTLDDDLTAVRILQSQKKKEEKKNKRKEIKKGNKKEEVKKEINKEILKEFEFDLKTISKIDYDKLEKKYQKKSEDNKTRIIGSRDIFDIEKTVIVKKPEPKESFKKNQNEKINDNNVDTVMVSSHEETKISDSKTLLLKAEIDFAESEKELKESESTLEEKNSKEELAERTIVKKVYKKKRSLILIILFLFLAYLILDEEKPKDEIIPIWPEIAGPIINEHQEKNIEKAKKLFNDGVEYYSKNTYRNKLIAAKKFKESLEMNYEKNPSLGMLIRVYSEIFPESKNKKKSSIILLNLLKISRADLVKNIDVVLGTSQFYFNFKRYLSAARVIENYLLLENRPSIDLFSLYLKILINLGRLNEAKKVFLKISNAPEKTLKSFSALAQYHEIEEDYESAEKIIRTGLQNFPESVGLRLDLAKYLLRKEHFKGYSLVLKEIESLRAEEQPSYFANFLKHMGILSSYGKNDKKAAFFFKLSLKVREDEDLRFKLASLKVQGSSFAQQLILESKVIDLMRKSKKLSRQKKWKQAFSMAIKAADLNHYYAPAQINLAQLQIKRGYIENSIKILEEARQKSPNHPYILFSLVEAFIASRKKPEAINLISQISNSKLKFHPAYSSLMGKFYYEFDNAARAVSFLNKSLDQNPLRDKDYFLKAKIFMKNRQYDDAKRALFNAIDLDPLNMEYHSLQGKILYELNGSDVAIGYLRKLLKEKKEDPILLGDIAIYYYKNGKIKQFREYRNKISKLKKRNADFFRFLIHSSKLEEKNDNVIKYSEELLRIEPGDNQVRLNLGIAYFLAKRYKKAIKIFNDVIERFSSYPRAHYYLAKVHLKLGNIDSALEMGKKEIQLNPKLYYGYYIVGEIHRLQKNIPDALNMFEKSLSLNPNNTDSFFSLCWIKRRQNHLELALEYCLSAKNGDPSNPKIRRELGNVYAQIGQNELAIEEWKTYLNLYPNAPDRKRVKSNIRILQP